MTTRKDVQAIRNDVDEIGWELGGLLLAFAQRPRNWLVLARNLAPVAGVFLLGWSNRVTVLSYWVDGVALLALLLGAMFVRGGVMLYREGRFGILALVLQCPLGFALFFGLFGVPYWMVWLELGLGESAQQVASTPLLATWILCIVLADVIGAFLRGGYFGMPMEALQKRAKPEATLIAQRGIAMVVLVWWTHGVLLAPLFAVVLTVSEVWPQVREDWNRLGDKPAG